LAEHLRASASCEQEDARVVVLNVLNTACGCDAAMALCTAPQVPKTKSVTSHLLSGPARINLTFRQLQPPWAAAVPQCRCGRQAIMRCGLQGGSFVYYYACDNTQGPGCGMYKAAVTLKPAG
jgi:hypothetical protein